MSRVTTQPWYCWRNSAAPAQGGGINGGAFSTGLHPPGGWVLVLHLEKPTYRGKHVVRSHTQGRPLPTQDRVYRERIIAGKSCRLSDLVSATAKPISCTWCSGFGDRTSRARGRTHLHRGGWAGAYQHIQGHRQTQPGRQTPSGLRALTLPGASPWHGAPVPAASPLWFSRGSGSRICASGAQHLSLMTANPRRSEGRDELCK